MVSLLLLDLPSDESYKIIFMQRDMPEILASQRKMLERLDQDTGPDDDEMEELFSGHLSMINSWIDQQKNIDVLYMRYNELMENPYRGQVSS